jgi:hypothetical protein
MDITHFTVRNFLDTEKVLHDKARSVLELIHSIDVIQHFDEMHIDEFDNDGVGFKCEVYIGCGDYEDFYTSIPLRLLSATEEDIIQYANDGIAARKAKEEATRLKAQEKKDELDAKTKASRREQYKKLKEEFAEE